MKRDKIKEVFGNNLSEEEYERLRKMDLPLCDVVGSREVTQEQRDRAEEIIKKFVLSEGGKRGPLL